MTNINKCKIEDCEKVSRARGWCDTHYQRWVRNGDVETKRTKPFLGKITETHKECGECHEMKLFSEFNLVSKKQTTSSVKNTRSYCKKCSLIITKRTRFGLTKEDYNLLLLLADNKCQICNKPCNKLNIDHDHKCCPPGNSNKCGKCNRGLICNHCNWALGHIEDNPKVLISMANYINNPPFKQVSSTT